MRNHSQVLSTVRGGLSVPKAQWEATHVSEANLALSPSICEMMSPRLGARRRTIGRGVSASEGLHKSTVLAVGLGRAARW